ncbi:FAD-dependent monooxygenase [Methylocella sp. CPCC 101449]|jgi:salicylate hydroxylase/6-hydroxynicotinate 3-monooxygenase|uniref:FAD-dependent monooxygenase n=1 Tax=Methylocella sp. CPCC 101449 TaxID=2987531 RepID=UPI00288FABBB|nr:FAD-dependent monooxygenase [Methylocella sp. CPCC 101449]MDT2021327.1 FAD-dependent monooxygenase [Methylocella sp. CPCC 101449]HEV2571419.1 FAD-dependent monooxygenase [Beijerinckiaceae bacterium]
MARSRPTIAIVGAGMGGLAAAATLRQVGIEVQVYEQAHQFLRVGAGIQMLPNASRVLRGIGIEKGLRKIAFEPYSHLNRVWDTGEIKRELPMPESLYGAPFLCMHRADLHEALVSVLPPDIIHLNKKLVGLDQSDKGVTLSFADGTKAQADAVIGADGVHSLVRSLIVGPDAPLHKGRIAYRAVFDSSLMNGGQIAPSRTKWWGPDRHIVIYYTAADRSQLYFVTSVPESTEWMTQESWSTKGDVHELRAAYEGFHPEVRMVLEACPDCHKWAILEREPLPHWSIGRIALMGDACHPMTPYMAQGAATSIEDAAVLARCFAETNNDDIEGAFRLYEANRKPRTSRIQAISSANTWMSAGNDDTSWLYGYDAWTVPLVPADQLTMAN